MRYKLWLLVKKVRGKNFRGKIRDTFQKLRFLKIRFMDLIIKFRNYWKSSENKIVSSLKISKRRLKRKRNNFRNHKSSESNPNRRSKKRFKKKKKKSLKFLRDLKESLSKVSLTSLKRKLMNLLLPNQFIRELVVKKQWVFKKKTFLRNLWKKLDL